MSMRSEAFILFHVFGLPVTCYALCLVVSLAAGYCLFFFRCRRMKIEENAAWACALFAVPLGLLGARLFYSASLHQMYLEIGLEKIFTLWEGGYALWGAVGGAVLAAVFAGKKRRETARLLDALAPAGALAIGLMRFAEYFSGEGIGDEVELPFFCRFPFAVYDAEYEVWYWAVFVLEGLAAIAILFALLKKERPKGDTARLFFILYGSCQILLESLRRDHYLRYLHVRICQLTAILVIAALMIGAILRWRRDKERRRMTGKAVALCCGAVLACSGLIVALEFSIFGKIWIDLPVWAAYLMMAACCAVIGWASGQVILRSTARENATAE